MIFAGSANPEMGPFGVLLIAFWVLSILLFIAAMILRNIDTRVKRILAGSSFGSGLLSIVFLSIWVGGFQIEHKEYLGWGMAMFLVAYMFLISSIYFRDVRYVGVILFALFFAAAIAGLGLALGYGRAYLGNETVTPSSSALSIILYH